MTVDLEKAKKDSSKRLPIPALAAGLAGLLMLGAAAYLWLSAHAQPVQVESGDRPTAYSLTLDDPDVFRIDRQGARNFFSGSDRVLQNGYYSGVMGLWPDLERTAPDPGLKKIKIVPSGGLYPFYRSSTFKGEVESFVRNGGSLICFGQPLGAMFGALPGIPAGIGWAELSILPREGYDEVEVALDHPVTSVLKQTRFNLHFCGFFTKIPGTEQTQVLLRDTTTGQPVVIAYRHGKGLVIATTMVCDAAALHYRMNAEERLFLDSLLTWARTGGAGMPQYNAGDQVEMVLRFPASDNATSTGAIEVYRPDGGLERSDTVDLTAGNGEEYQEYQTISEPCGIWRLVTYRLDANGEPVGERISSWYAVGHASVGPGPTGTHIAVTVPGPNLVAGEATIRIHLWNTDSTRTEVTYRGPSGKKTVSLNSGQYKVMTDQVTIDGTNTQTLSYEFYGADGQRLKTVKRRVTGGNPDRIFMVLSGKKSAVAGRTLPITLTALSVNPGEFKVDCWLRLVHNGSIVWREHIEEMALNGAYSHSEKINVALPKEITGRLVLEASLTHDGKELAQAWTEIAVSASD